MQINNINFPPEFCGGNREQPGWRRALLWNAHPDCPGLWLGPSQGLPALCLASSRIQRLPGAPAFLSLETQECSFFSCSHYFFFFFCLYIIVSSSSLQSIFLLWFNAESWLVCIQNEGQFCRRLGRDVLIRECGAGESSVIFLIDNTSLGRGRSGINNTPPPGQG